MVINPGYLPFMAVMLSVHIITAIAAMYLPIEWTPIKWLTPRDTSDTLLAILVMVATTTVLYVYARNNRGQCHKREIVRIARVSGIPEYAKLEISEYGNFAFHLLYFGIAFLLGACVLGFEYAIRILLHKQVSPLISAYMIVSTLLYLPVYVMWLYPWLRFFRRPNPEATTFDMQLLQWLMDIALENIENWPNPSRDQVQHKSPRSRSAAIRLMNHLTERHSRLFSQ